MEKKQNLIKALKVAINALTNGTIFYNWVNPTSCNCGIVAQAVLGVSPIELKQIATPFFEKSAAELKRIAPSRKDGHPTWKESVQTACPITGEPTFEIIKRLKGIGMDKEDIVHLEFLENPAILALSGIKKEPIYERKIQSEKVTEVPVAVTDSKQVRSNSFLKRVLGIKDTVIEHSVKMEKKTDTHYAEVKTGEKYPKNYYQLKSNLILYLTAWLKILEGNIEETQAGMNNKEKLQADLLIATANENYEGAANIRDKILQLA